MGGINHLKVRNRLKIYLFFSVIFKQLELFYTIKLFYEISLHHLKSFYHDSINIDYNIPLSYCF